MNEYTTTVGIEVHAELKTASKMFCSCKNDPHNTEPNTHICPVCMAHPGTLPVVNQAAVEKVLLVGNAIGATLADFSEFDRKNYFYPDIPKAYQISQLANPLVSGGSLAGVDITRIHLEEDTARSQHQGDKGSVVDFNRAGVPLMELVTEPVIHSPEAAGAFARELQLLLRTMGVSDANMERGEMRVEANISVSKTDVFGTKVEVKNLNSFKVMEAAIAYETKRQIEVLESGGTLVQETRGWDEQKGKTFSQRIKETSDDYRYFPDPDIPKYVFSELPEMSSSRLDEITPILPDKIRSLYRDLGIKSEMIEVVLNDKNTLAYLERCREITSAESLLQSAVNYMTGDVMRLRLDNPETEIDLDTAKEFIALLTMAEAGSLSSRGVKDLLGSVLFEAAEAENEAIKRGLIQQNDTDALQKIVDTVIADNESVVAEYKAGKEASIKFLVGQGMKASKGSANPQVLESLLKETL